MHLEKIEDKLSKKVNLFKKIKSSNINSIKINLIIFKSIVRSIFDYAFIQPNKQDIKQVTNNANLNPQKNQILPVSNHRHIGIHKQEP